MSPQGLVKIPHRWDFITEVMSNSARAGAKSQSGFTLIELLVVISIIAILSVIGMAVFSNVQKGARDAKRKSDIDAISKALELYKSVNGQYPFPGSPPMLPANPWYCSGYQGSNGLADDNNVLTAQIITALSPYLQKLPHDPLDTSPYQYKLDILSQEGYWLYATLENPPPTPWPVTNGDGCGVLPVHILITNQQ